MSALHHMPKPGPGRWMAHFLFLIALALAGCGGSGGGNITPPAPPAPPAPVTIPRPGTLTYSANWTAPIGAALFCLDDGPGDIFACHLPAGALWGVLPQAGNGGIGCVDPEPNACFQPSGGVLGYSAGTPGMALISAQSVPATAPVSIEAVVTINFDCTQGVPYTGPVVYDGEGPPTDPTGNYLALYLSCTGGMVDSQIQAWVYWGAVNLAAPLATNGTTYANGSTHALRIDYIPGVSATYFVDDVVVGVDTAATWGAAAFTFSQPPHPALWFGASTGSVWRFDWYVED